MLALAGLAVGCCHPRGRPYPIGLYGVSHPEDLVEVKAAGFNLVTGPARRDYLDAAQAVGLRVLATPGTTAGPRFDPGKARRTVQDLDRHPALWAWYLVDEPDFHTIPPDEVAAAQRFVKRAGATKPTALTLFQGYETRHYGRLTDLLLVDRYPIPWLPLANFGQHLRLGRLGAGPDRPLLAVIQAFDWTYYPDVMREPGPFRPPTYEEIRCMTYCALGEGANGLFYYTYADSRWRLRDHPETYDAVRRVVAEVNRRSPLFAGEPRWWPRHQRFGDRSRRFNAALLASVTASLIHVKAGNPTVPPGQYVMAVNTTPDTQRYSFQWPDEADGEVPVMEEARTTRVHAGWVTDEFAPYAVHVYGPR